MRQVTWAEFSQLKTRVDGAIQLVQELSKVMTQFHADTTAKIDAFIKEHNAKVDGVIEDLDAQDDGDAWKKA